MGIIKLDSFSPEEIGTKILAVEKATMIVRSLLANELKDTHSVMYELRGNSGGDAEFADMHVESAGIEEFSVFQADGKTVIAKKEKKVSTYKQTFSIPMSAVGRALGISDSVGLYQPSTTAPADGWNNLKGPWMIGNGVKYVSNVDSSIEAFFTASVGTKINIGLDIAPRFRARI
ncbi:hypothetical protein BASA83_005643 [Batrachochytrium salamandrivorans]|nr:hypothetical protein BASA83_005643 [Batrachochytrium salamandrivorans]